MLLSLASQLLRSGERHRKVSYSRAATFNGNSGDPHLELRGIQVLMEILSRASFRRDLESLCGYDTKVAGRSVM